MKNVLIIVLGFTLSIVLLAWPAEYTQDITAGLGFILAAVLVAWLGIRHRKGTRADYEDDVRRYTASTIMKVVQVDESVLEMWELQDDGRDELRRVPTYLPTYEYTVDGKTYHYHSRQSLSGKRDLGLQVVGYYDPKRPSCITENRPRSPIFGGIGFFVFAAFLFWFGIMTFAGQVSFS